eukprot:13936_1
MAETAQSCQSFGGQPDQQQLLGGNQECVSGRDRYHLLGQHFKCALHPTAWSYSDGSLCREVCIANSKCSMWTFQYHARDGQHCCLNTNSDKPVTAAKNRVGSAKGGWISGARSNCVNRCPASELKSHHVQNVGPCDDKVVGDSCQVQLQCPDSSTQTASVKCEWTPYHEAHRNFTKFTKWWVDSPCTAQPDPTKLDPSPPATPSAQPDPTKLDPSPENPSPPATPSVNVGKIVRTVFIVIGIIVVISALGFYIWKKHYVPWKAANAVEVEHENIPNHLRFSPHEPVKKNNLPAIELEDQSEWTAQSAVV